MDFTIFSEIEITTLHNENYFIYWRDTDCYEGNKHFRKIRQVVQYHTGLLILPVTFEVILKFIKLEKGSKLQLGVEQRNPLGKIIEVPFFSKGIVKSISYKK